MKDFVNIMGKDNLFIICSIIAVIIVALLVIVIIEKVSARKYRLKRQVELPSYKEIDTYDYNNVTNYNEEQQVNLNIGVSNDNLIKEEDKQEVVYVTTNKTEEEAKKELEEAAKKLVYEEKNDLIGPTFFEKVQEEKSIISYDELLKANLDPDELDNYRVEDEGNEPITLDELYKKNIDDLIEKQEEKINNFNKIQEKEPKKFKNSSVISPVFGIKNDNEYKKLEAYKSTNVKNIEDEIKKTEEFLSELKKLKERIEK